MGTEKYFTIGIIKKMDLEDQKVVIIGENHVRDKNDHEYSVWLNNEIDEHNKIKLSKKALVLDCEEALDFSTLKNRTKMTLSYLAVNNKKACFFITKTDKSKHEFRLENLEIINE